MTNENDKQTEPLEAKLVEQTDSKNTLGEKIAGVIAGTGATIACMYNPSLTPSFAVAGAATAVATASVAAAAATGGIGMIIAAMGVGAAVAGAAAGDAVVYGIIIAAGAVVGDTARAAAAADVTQQEKRKMKSFLGAGLLATAFLAGGYFVGKDRSSISAVTPSGQGLTIQQKNGNIHIYQRNADGTYVPLERRLNK